MVTHGFSWKVHGIHTLNLPLVMPDLQALEHNCQTSFRLKGMAGETNVDREIFIVKYFVNPHKIKN